MRTAVVALALLAFLGGLGWFVYTVDKRRGRSPASDLAPFVDRNLRLLDERDKARLNKAIDQRLPANYRTDRTILGAPETWLLWKHDLGDGRQGFVVFQAFPLVMIPGGSGAAFHSLDDRGN